MNIVEPADHIVERSMNAARLMRSIDAHLREETAEAIWAPVDHPSARAPSDWRSVDEPPVPLQHADPTPQMAQRVGRDRRMRRELIRAMRQIDGALDALERVASAVIAVKPGDDLAAEPRCPGWTEEQRQDGGCGKHLEAYRRDDGTEGLRSLCSACRKAKGKRERETEQVAV